jgi:hypothetical protein
MINESMGRMLRGCIACLAATGRQQIRNCEMLYLFNASDFAQASASEVVTTLPLTGLALTNPEKSSGFLSSGVERVTSTSNDEVVSSILAESIVTYLRHRVLAVSFLFVFLLRLSCG